MNQGVLDKAELPELIEALKAEYRVYAPVNDNGDVVLAEVSRPEDVVLDYANFTLSPKILFFPQSEVLCTFCDGNLSEVPALEDRFVVFGARPCDARALLDLDTLFGELSTGIRDPYYMRRRDNGLVISVACNEPLDSCFCASFDGGPCSDKGSDILAFDLGESLFLRACTDKGKDLMAACADMLGKVGSNDQKACKRVAADADKKAQKVEIKGLTDRLRNGFDMPAWEDISRICIGCGVCTYLCPTCHCFDITDEAKGDRGRRIRSWDSCQYALFTLHTSGHNPRPSKKERLRQRVMHKFAYTVENFDEIFCVGCGRCVRACPVNLDIRQTIDTIRNA